ncbi:MAG: UDP-N-acetylmuramoyl-L-alanyl-D-glutamate--2,6-diaminopimelate ligase [Gammaproteobacteria bacterium]
MTANRRVSTLSTLLKGFSEVSPYHEREITGVSIDSRKINKGDLFIAFPGLQSNGIDYIHDAVEAGASAIVYDMVSEQYIKSDIKRLLDERGIPLLVAVELQSKVGVIASRFFNDPSRNLFVIGITGTNGKTSCCHFLAQALSDNKERCGVIGTIGYGVYGDLREASHTTPDGITLQSLLAELRDKNVKYVVMEVSSHALEQDRISGIDFNIAVLTNLTHEHLDYHGNMDAYSAAKKKLFFIPGLQFAVINRDDRFGRSLQNDLRNIVSVVEFGLCDGGDSGLPDGEEVGPDYVLADLISQSREGISLKVSSSWGEGLLASNIFGRFNASNLLAVLSILLLLGIPIEQALIKLKELRTVPGRMEIFGGRDGSPVVVVDYAHSPDSLENVLLTLQGHCEGQLLCVFGCGGNRDQAKRPLMGEVAEQYADAVIITDDNPRQEDSRDIADGIMKGIKQVNKVQFVPDRTQAISWAINHAGEKDIVLVAGKGHEKYQLIGHQVIPFSDRDVVCDLLGEVA